MTQSLLEIQDLSISFGGLMAVRSLDLVVQPGEVVGLIGPNGAGKTTVFNCISRFYTPSRGKIIFQGRDISRLPSHAIIGQGIARTFQNVELCQSMTTLENLLLGQHVHLKSGAIRDGLRLPGVRRSETRAIQRAEEVMELLNLAPFRDRVASTLPFGVQKMIELGRALVSRPLLLLLDEPVAGHDEQETEMLAELIERIHQQFDLSILVVEHDMPFVMGLCNRLYVLDFGQIIAEGEPAQIRNNPKVIEAYLGEPDMTVSED